MWSEQAKRQMRALVQKLFFFEFGVCDRDKIKIILDFIPDSENGQLAYIMSTTHIDLFITKLSVEHFAVWYSLYNSPLLKYDIPFLKEYFPKDLERVKKELMAAIEEHFVSLSLKFESFLGKTESVNTD